MTKLLMILLVALCFKTHAQFNDSINYYVNYASTGFINKTNDGNAYVLNNGLKFNVYKRNYALNTLNSWIYGENQVKKTNNDFTSVVDFSLFKTERHIYYWALTNFEKSFSLKIDKRLQSGAGIGYYVIDRKNFVLQLSDGILYENSDLYDTEAGANKYETIRNSFRIKFRLVYNDLLTLDGSDFAQHSLKDKKDYIIKSNTTLGIKIMKWLSITVAVNYNKLSVTARENLLINYGLTIEKYF